jgi:hypothetical protein
MPANVRIQAQTYAKLRKLADGSGLSLPEMLDEAVETLFRRRFVEECNRAYARLKADPKARRRAAAEQQAWDATLADGLADA